ncbi:MAG: 2-C-methyl-D-erythritol 4-phosphate cytidylyltransferase [Spirochaetes bacterium]|nr:2-C-methyl-D-erythritol 4-phosphate cytidylyltransferase [Spirochaetota bacterium]
MKHCAIIVAGGVGQRMGSSVPKQFLQLGTKPIIAWSVETFITSKLIDIIIIAIHPDYKQKLQEIVNIYFPNNKIIIANGGATRQESCYNALNAYDFSANDIVLIHDAARPFITSTMIKQCIEGAKQNSACGIYVPVKETIAHIADSTVAQVLPRQTLYAAQTPQCFRYSIISDAHKKARDNNIRDATDDVSLVVMAGYTVKAIIGDFYSNIKITTNQDMELAKVLVIQKHHNK